MNKTILLVLIGVVAAYMLAIIAINIVFVFKIFLCVLALRYLFSEFPDAD